MKTIKNLKALQLLILTCLAMLSSNTWAQNNTKAPSAVIGEDAFPFKLEDANGKTYTSEDFDGKCLIIEYWVTGNKDCVQITDSLRSNIYALKNPNAIFISICTDKNKSLWLKSLKSGKYTDKKEMNLFDESGESLFAKHYHISSYPTLIVISTKNKVISLNAPNPKTDPQGFKDVLYKGLNVIGNRVKFLGPVVRP